ncbi:hypothetical protein BDW72DRAFT_158696 [Aspergillus terricola var. indicus]
MLSTSLTLDAPISIILTFSLPSPFPQTSTLPLSLSPPSLLFSLHPLFSCESLSAFRAVCPLCSCFPSSLPCNELFTKCRCHCGLPAGNLRRDNSVSPYGFNSCSLPPNRVHDPLCPLSNWFGIQRSPLVLCQKKFASCPLSDHRNLHGRNTPHHQNRPQRRNNPENASCDRSFRSLCVSFPLVSLIRCC